MEITTQQAALRLGVSRRRVTALIGAGRLTARTNGWGFWLLDSASVDRFRNSPRRAGRPKKSGNSTKSAPMALSAKNLRP